MMLSEDGKHGGKPARLGRGDQAGRWHVVRAQSRGKSKRGAFKGFLLLCRVGGWGGEIPLGSSKSEHPKHPLFRTF